MKLDSVVPWGRSLAEYRTMFMLTDDEMKRSILGCGDGPASFNAELTRRGGNITSVDPVYQFSRDEIAHRIDEVAEQVLQELEKNRDNYLWEHIPNVQALAKTRKNAMTCFLEDYESGRQQGRYLNGSLPHLPFFEGQFELALCSHFLFLYSDHLDLEFHRASLKELGRVAREIRIYPLVTLDGRPSPHLTPVCDLLRQDNWLIAEKPVTYQFQKGAVSMLVLRKTA